MKPATPTKEFMDHLRIREGDESEVYLDTSDKPTVGVGHLLTAEERKLYPEGTTIDKEQLDLWLEIDSSVAYNAGLAQAKEAGITDQKMVEALGSVNYQLGRGWREKFPSAWTAIKEGDFIEAVDQIKYKNKNTKEKSAWYKETSTRVEDFEKALTAYGKKVKPQDYAMQEWVNEDNIFTA
jgi:GH24 family phage-related lysozyme (muramidase)